ncbi:hypothetical protein CHU98_g5414 [Xylaria longipes]|nr:hypothetical protein CHU98_g5414 [Xylaria longipes]
MITHRDIKDTNTLVHGRIPEIHKIHVKLSDFGLAAEETASMRSYCGTRPYLAPEVRRGGKYTNKVDIWSLAVMTLEISYGLPESSGRSRPRRPKLTDYLSHFSETPLVDFIEFMLEHRPQRRPDAQKALGHDIFSQSLCPWTAPRLRATLPGEWRTAAGAGGASDYHTSVCRPEQLVHPSSSPASSLVGGVFSNVNRDPTTTDETHTPWPFPLSRKVAPSIEGNQPPIFGDTKHCIEVSVNLGARRRRKPSVEFIIR